MDWNLEDVIKKFPFPGDIEIWTVDTDYVSLRVKYDGATEIYVCAFDDYGQLFIVHNFFEGYDD